MRPVALAVLVLAAIPAFAARPDLVIPSAEVGPLPLESARAAARAAWRVGDVAGAAAIARTFLRDPPPSGVVTRGAVLLQSAHFGGSAAPAHAALPADPDTVDGLVELGWFLARAGDHRGAVDLLEAVLAARPDHAEAHLLVAESRLALGHRDDAMRHSARYLELTTGIPQS